MNEFFLEYLKRQLTAFFAKDMTIVAPEEPSGLICDLKENGFIPGTLLEVVMKSLGSVSDPEFVKLTKTKLDLKGLDIVLLGLFLSGFSLEPDSGVSVIHCLPLQ